MAELSPVKIKKIFEAGKLIYPATILDAVKDGSKTISVNGEEVENPSYGKTVREIIVDNEKVTAAALNDHETRILDLEAQFEGDESVDAKIEAEKNRAEEAEGDLSDRLDAVEATHATKEDGSFKTVSEEVSEAIADVVADAPEAFDTLKEIADWIQKDAENANGFDAAQRIVDLEEKVGEAGVEADPENNVEGKEATGLYKAIEDAIADANSAIDDLDASDNVSEEVAGITVQVDQEDGAIAKPVVTVTAAEVTCTEGTEEVDADLTVDVEASVLDGSAVAAIKSYVDNHFSTEACSDTTDYADVF